MFANSLYLTTLLQILFSSPNDTFGDVKWQITGVFTSQLSFYYWTFSSECVEQLLMAPRMKHTYNYTSTTHQYVMRALSFRASRIHAIDFVNDAYWTWDSTKYWKNLTNVPIFIYRTLFICALLHFYEKFPRSTNNIFSS